MSKLVSQYGIVCCKFIDNKKLTEYNSYPHRSQITLQNENKTKYNIAL